jgi:hypothetical protein
MCVNPHSPWIQSRLDFCCLGLLFALFSSFFRKKICTVQKKAVTLRPDMVVVAPKLFLAA